MFCKMDSLTVFDRMPSPDELATLFGVSDTGLGYFYCLDCIDCVKIGCTQNVSSRMKSLKSYLSANNKEAVRVAVSVIHANYKENEKALHSFFASKRVSGTELFSIQFDDFVFLLDEIGLSFEEDFVIRESKIMENGCINCGDRIKSYRASINASQEHIARLMGVSRATVVNWEKGNTEPSMSEAVKLAGLFGTTVENLMK